MISSNYYRIDVCFFFGVNARNQKTAPRVRGFLRFCFEASIRQSFYFLPLSAPSPLPVPIITRNSRIRAGTRYNSLFSQLEMVILNMLDTARDYRHYRRYMTRLGRRE